MVTASSSPFDAYRVNATTTLSLLSQGQQWQEQILKLQQRRLECDRAALEGTLDTWRHAHDWTDMATASQSVLRDYLSTNTAIWQESVAAAMQGAGAWAETARAMAQRWQDSLTGLQRGTNAASALPMREWMSAFERAVGAAVPEAAQSAEDVAQSAARAAKQAAAAQGGRHGS